MDVREKLLGAMIAPAAETVNVGGMQVRVRCMDGQQRDAWSAEWDTYRTQKELPDSAMSEFYAMLIVHCVVDDQNKRVFEPADISALVSRAAMPLTRLGQACMRVNGVGARAIEDAEKNLDGAPSGSGGFDSPGSGGAPSKKHSGDAIPASSANGSPTTGSTRGRRGATTGTPG